MSRDIQVINEFHLVGFRACELAPARLYQQMPGNDEVLLIPLPPGIGKSRAAQALVGYALEHDHDLVIYVAPTRGIIDEIEVVQELPAEAVVTLNPRPGCFAATLLRPGRISNAPAVPLSPRPPCARAAASAMSMAAIVRGPISWTRSGLAPSLWS
jgi:hypothetical protein